MAMVDRRFRTQIKTGPTTQQQSTEDGQGMFGRTLAGITGAINQFAAKRAAKQEDKRADDFMNRKGEFRKDPEFETLDMRTMARNIDPNDPNQVMAFQQAVNNMGGNLKIDGKFGPNTLSALREVQGMAEESPATKEYFGPPSPDSRTAVMEQPVIQGVSPEDQGFEPVTQENLDDRRGFEPVTQENLDARRGTGNRIGSRAEVASRDIEPLSLGQIFRRALGIPIDTKFGQGNRKSRRNK